MLSQKLLFCNLVQFFFNPNFFGELKNHENVLKQAEKILF